MYGDIFNPMAFFDINMKCYQNMARYHTIFWNFLKPLKNGMHPSNLTLIEPHI